MTTSPLLRIDDSRTLSREQREPTEMKKQGEETPSEEGWILDSYRQVYQEPRDLLQKIWLSKYWHSNHMGTEIPERSKSGDHDVAG